MALWRVLDKTSARRNERNDRQNRNAEQTNFTEVKSEKLRSKIVDVFRIDDVWRDSSKLKRIIYDKLIFIYVVDIPALSQSILLYALLYLIEFRYFPHRRLNAS